MKRIVCILLLAIPGLNLRAAEDVDPEEIIKRFAAKELEFKAVWEQQNAHNSFHSSSDANGFKKALFNLLPWK